MRWSGAHVRRTEALAAPRDLVHSPLFQPRAAPPRRPRRLLALLRFGDRSNYPWGAGAGADYRVVVAGLSYRVETSTSRPASAPAPDGRPRPSSAPASVLGPPPTAKASERIPSTPRQNDEPSRLQRGDLGRRAARAFTDQDEGPAQIVAWSRASFTTAGSSSSGRLVADDAAEADHFAPALLLPRPTRWWALLLLALVRHNSLVSFRSGPRAARLERRPMTVLPG